MKIWIKAGVIIIKQLGLTFRADMLILWIAGIEAVDA